MKEKWGYLEQDERQQKAKQDKKESGEEDQQQSTIKCHNEARYFACSLKNKTNKVTEKH